MVLIEKRYQRKRLSEEQAKDDAGQQPGLVAGGLTGKADLSLSLKSPLIQPKTEPEEQDSKLTSNTTCFFFTYFV